MMVFFNVKFVASSSEQYLCRFGKYSLSWLNYPCSEYVLYDIGLCSKYSVSVFKRMEACYNKFIKSFLNTVGLTVLVTC